MVVVVCIASFFSKAGKREGGGGWKAGKKCLL